MISSANIAKEAAAIAALELILDDMTVGLGTGSTAAYFIKHLAEKCRQGLRIQAVATSQASENLARENKIPLVDINTLSSIDVAVDGADEIDSKNRLIKGGGGAAFREKIVAAMSQQFIIIADENKCVRNFGKFPLAVEILPFGYYAILAKLQNIGYNGKLRKNKNGTLFLSDNGNYIFDISLTDPCLTPEIDDQKIKSVVGVIETGFFLNMASKILIGYADQHVKMLSPLIKNSKVE